MSMALQAKVQALVALLAALVLFSGPLFHQVRADARDEKDQVKTTWGHKVGNEIAKWIDKDALKDAQVDDAWGEWQKNNEDCGPPCDPDGDLDNDGMTNREEIQQGRNPNCNEDVEGADVCAGKNPNPTEEPPVPPPIPAKDDLLYSIQQAPVDHFDSFTVTALDPEYDRWIVSWELRQYQGFDGYRIIIDDEEGQTWCCDFVTTELLQSDDSGSRVLEGDDLPPSGADYTIQVSSNAFEGQWDLSVRGVRDAVEPQGNR